MGTAANFKDMFIFHTYLAAPYLVWHLS